MTWLRLAAIGAACVVVIVLATPLLVLFSALPATVYGPDGDGWE